jgi:hypothetical protein
MHTEGIGDPRRRRTLWLDTRNHQDMIHDPRRIKPLHR